MMQTQSHVTLQPAVDLHAIEAAAVMLAGQRRALEAELQAADEKLARVREAAAGRLRKAAQDTQAAEKRLLRLVEAAPQLFTRPQSMEFDGVKVGWRKGKGRLELPDTEKLVQRAEDLLTPAQRKAVLKVKTTVLKGGLAKLSGDLLKKLGVTLTAAGPEPFVTYPKSPVEKMVDWWLKPLAAADSEED